MVYCGNNVSRETYKRRKIMVQLLKTETFLKRARAEEIHEIYSRILEKSGRIERTIIAKSGGYVKEEEEVLALYNGRYGVGISLFYKNYKSTRYCNKTYIIFDIEYEGLKKMVSDILNIEIEEGEAKWQ